MAKEDSFMRNAKGKERKGERAVDIIDRLILRLLLSTRKVSVSNLFYAEFI